MAYLKVILNGKEFLIDARDEELLHEFRKANALKKRPSKVTQDDKEVLYAIATLPFLFAFAGAVVSILWMWFAKPLGAPGIGFSHGAGLYLLGRIVSTRSFHGSDDRMPWNLGDVVGDSIRLVSALGFGFAFHLISLI